MAERIGIKTAVTGWRLDHPNEPIHVRIDIDVTPRALADMYDPYHEVGDAAYDAVVAMRPKHETETCTNLSCEAVRLIVTHHDGTIGVSEPDTECKGYGEHLWPS